MQGPEQGSLVTPHLPRISDPDRLSVRKDPLAATLSSHSNFESVTCIIHFTTPSCVTTMGGNAFNAVVNFSGIFPRMQPALYRCLRQKHEDALKKLYTLVGTPAEAPEKVDHGDVDFIVWHPCPVDHLSVQEALKASHVKPIDGPRTSNYAVPLDAHDEYCQVDVHVCATEGEWQRTMFFHSYGDMGMILGLIARGVGLHLGVHGLRVSTLWLTRTATHLHVPSTQSQNFPPGYELVIELSLFVHLTDCVVRAKCTRMYVLSRPYPFKEFRLRLKSSIEA